MGDRRRNKRLVQVAVQVAARPDGSTPGQTETWACLKGTYRLFAADDVTFQEIIAPHCRHTRERCLPGGVKLILNDTVAEATEANRVIGFYERRPTIEDYHKCYKTGCRVESRQYGTADRLERVAGLLSVVAVRLLQMRTAARETPERPAEEVAPRAWIEMLSAVRRLRLSP